MKSDVNIDKELQSITSKNLGKSHQILCKCLRHIYYKTNNGFNIDNIKPENLQDEINYFLQDIASDIHTIIDMIDHIDDDVPRDVDLIQLFNEYTDEEKFREHIPLLKQLYVQYQIHLKILKGVDDEV